MTCTVGVVSGVAIEVIHPGVRSTGSAVLSLFQNLFGLAVGPFLVGVLSDIWGLQQALAVIPLFSILAAVLFDIAMRSYDADAANISNVKLDVAPVRPSPRWHRGRLECPIRVAMNACGPPLILWVRCAGLRLPSPKLTLMHCTPPGM